MILVVAAGLSAAVVWWAMEPAKPKRARKPPRPAVASVEDASSESFVLPPAQSSAIDEERPAAAWSLLRLVVTIAVVSAFVVAVLAAFALLVKLQLDEYFV